MGRFVGPDAGGVHASRRAGIVAPTVDENRPDGAAVRPGFAVGGRRCREAGTKTGPIRWLGDVPACRPAGTGPGGVDGNRPDPVARGRPTLGGRPGPGREAWTKDGLVKRPDVHASRPAAGVRRGVDKRPPDGAAGRPSFAAGRDRAARRGRKAAPLGWAGCPRFQGRWGGAPPGVGASFVVAGGGCARRGARARCAGSPVRASAMVPPTPAV